MSTPRRLTRVMVSLATIAILGVILLPVPAQAAATFTVNSTLDPGSGGCNSTECTLREAMAASNASTGTLDLIRFRIGIGGVKTITPGSALPTVTDPVIIDGTTQPAGFLRGTCFAQSGHPCIVLNGASAGTTFGLYITAGGSTVKGLVVQGFGRVGISLESGGGNTITNTFIGTNSTGTSAVPNGQGGMEVRSLGNVIGGPTSASRNLISGNGDDLGRPGLFVDGSGNDIQSNYIGTNAAGTAALGNSGPGVWLQGPNNALGGPSGGGNVISGNGDDGVLVHIDADGSVVRNNRIGTDWAGAAAVPNTRDGVDVSFLSNVAVTGNTIAHNGGQGVRISSATAVLVRGNSIHSNGGLGIDLSPSGVTVNDPGDADTGTNNLLNYPVVRFAASASGFGAIVSGRLNSTPNTAFNIDLYSSPACDPSGSGEGQTLITSHSVTTNGAGTATFRIQFGSLLDQGRAITATATDPANNTSEFSVCRRVASLVTVQDFYYAPTPATVSQGIPVGWDFRGLSAHTVTDSSSMNLFGSGQRSFGGSYTFMPPGAGRYLYHCVIHPTQMTGAIRVPVIVDPSSGTMSTAFQVTWAPGPAPSGYVYDVQIKRPGASFTNFRIGKTNPSTTFTPDAGTGTYSFRARLRKISNNASSVYSLPTPISVS